jgi:tetratricopeptide (TPR) repeat protein
MAVLQVHAMLGVNDSGLLAAASRLLSSINEAMQADLPAEEDPNISAALAAACQSYVAAARDTDRRLDMVSGHEPYVEALRLWLAAERIGSVALKSYLMLRDKPDYQFEFASDVSGAGDAIVGSYPLALESLGKYAEAVAIYRQFIDRQESKRAAARTGDIMLTAQGAMKETYVRMSRCLFRQYLLEGDAALAVEAAEALERHKARRLRASILEAYDGDPAAWLSAPLRYAASRLPVDSAICCLGINPVTERIEGRWIYVGISGHESSTAGKIWVDEVSPGEQLEKIYDWFTERMAEVSRREREERASLPDLLRVIEEIVPEEEVRERFRVLGELLRLKGEAVRQIFLSTEHYAFHLPWAAALAVSTEGGHEMRVSIVPSCAFAMSGRQQQRLDGSPMNGVIYFDGGDPMLALAAEQMRADIDADSDGGNLWPVEMLTNSTATDPEAADLDLMVVISHGSQAEGISTGKLAASLQRKARCVLLLGCWSATMTTHSRHMEIEGTVTQFLESGAEAVVASVWPLPAFAAIQFGSAFAAALESGTDPSTAFSAAAQVLRLGGGPGSHPAVWGSFALYGCPGLSRQP